jgi:class 3 adenylate cyclase
MISPELRESFLHRYGGGARSAQLAKGYYRFAESLGSNATAEHQRRFFVPPTVRTTNVVFTSVCRSALEVPRPDPRAAKLHLDRVYREVFPEIYERHGEIDKLIGDSVIAVFGPPFVGEGPFACTEGLRAAEEFARRVIQKLAYTDIEVKCAIRQGPLCFTMVGSEQYHEPSVVGNTLAELHRLSGVSHARAMNMFADTVEHRFVEGLPTRAPATYEGRWQPSTHAVGDLKGVDFKRIYVQEWLDPTLAYQPTSWAR